MASIATTWLLVTAGFLGFITFESNVVSAGSTIYVGSGAGNHTTSIQDAIDNFANDGDTVFVYIGTYYENVIVNKSINLTGENRDKTVINGQGIYDTVFVSADWVNVSELSITNSGYNETPGTDAGIELNNVQNCRLFNLKVFNNLHGIYLDNSDGNTIIDNIAFSNNPRFDSSGIRLDYSNLNNIVNNKLTLNGGDGIYLLYSSDNIITGNNASDNGWNGIDITHSPSNTVVNNTCNSNHDHGIWLAYSDRIDIINNNASSNRYCGILVYVSSWNKVINNTALSNQRVGIWIAVQSMGNNVTGNTASSNYWNGILLLTDGYGDNIVFDNLISSNLEHGICLRYHSNGNTVIGNNVSNNGNGIYIIESSDNSIVGNNVSFNNVRGIGVNYSRNNRIIGNVINNNSEGINLTISSTDNVMTGNNISNNGNGFAIFYSHENTIISNSLYMNTWYGIDIKNGDNNTIYHNNFIDNNGGGVQARDNTGTNHWNDSYPSGGNYWNDWTIPDTMSGPNQDIPGSDGFVDVPYFLDGGANAKDYYPFTTLLDISPPIITNLQPPDTSTTNDSTPTISADYSDPSGIDVSSVVLKVDGIDVTSSAMVTASGVSYIPASALLDGGHTVYLEVKDVYGNLATATWSFVVDTTPPTITNLQPPDASITNDSTPLIGADYSDPSGINVSTVVLKVDGIDVTPSATVTASGVSYIPIMALPDGSHTVYLEVKDNIGNLATASWSFMVDTAIYPPINLTTKVVNNGNNVELEWDPSPALDHYLIYRTDSSTEFDFTIPYNSSVTWPDPMNTTWIDPDSGVTSVDDDFYYIVRAANFDESDISFTSNTAGVWTRTFESGISTFSLPLEPFEARDVEFYCQDMNASYIKWMNQTTHTWMRHDRGDSGNNTLVEVGEGYEIGFLGKSLIQTRYTFTGMPGAMIIYDDDILFSGFDPDSDGRNLTVAVEADGNVTLAWQEPATMGPGDWYEVYYSNSRDGFFGTLGIHYYLACPSIGFGTNTTTISGLGASNPGARLYFMVVPFNTLGIRGASTYSIGIWTEEYLAEYDTFGIPLKTNIDNTVDWYCDNVPDTVGMNYYIYGEQRWGWHSTRMPQGVYDPVLVMTEGYQISTSNGTKFTFIGV